MSRTVAMRDAPSVLAVGVLTGQHHLVGKALRGLDYKTRMETILDAQVQLSHLAKNEHIQNTAVEIETQAAKNKLEFIYTDQQKKGGINAH